MSNNERWIGWNKPVTILSLMAIAIILIAGGAYYLSRAPQLYGIISTGANYGYLISINANTGAATLIGNTGQPSLSGLTYNKKTGVLYAIQATGKGQVYSIDPSTGKATALSSTSMVNGANALAYRFVDNLLYAPFAGFNTSNIYQLNSATGKQVNDIGIVNKGPVTGLAVRPSDGVLFGAGTGNTIENWLFTIHTVKGPPPREKNVGKTNRKIRGLAFHPNGTLYATDGKYLLTINASTGKVAQIGDFGKKTGTVDGLSFVTP